jgi:mono/diheme cytochrome c family protein
MIVRNSRQKISRALIAAVLSTVTTSSALAQALSGYTGPSLYKHFCASCHGLYGKGDGPVASSLKFEVPDLTRIAARHGGQFPAEDIRKIIDGRTTRPPHGPRDMPVWGDAFRIAAGENTKAQDRTNESIELLTEYLRSIQVP